MLLVQNIFALDSVSAIPKNQKTVITRVATVLGLPLNKETRKLIYNKISFAFDKGWSAHWTTNTTGADSKIGDSKTQICDVTIYNNNRVVNATFVHFKKEKQLFITIKEYIDGSSKVILKAYNKRKNNPKYIMKNETDNYAYFQLKGYMDYVTYHISSPAGMVIYESSYILDIKE
jgi:hypothetical protein